MEAATTPASKPAQLQGWTAEDFLDRTMPPKEPLIEGLLHRRDLIALGARRRNGKTSFVTDLAVQLATGAPDFLGYKIAAPRRTLLVILEDDAGEFQEKLKRVIGDRDTDTRIRVATREDFFNANVPISIDDKRFLGAIQTLAAEHRPDVIVLDNLAQVVCADYNDAKKIHKVAQLCHDLARDHDAAIIVPAHPKKEDPMNPMDLAKNPTSFFEAIMGSSHFINSMGSLWGLQRDASDVSAFVGGRQRGDGQQSASYVEMDDEGHFRVASNVAVNLPLALNTPKRRQAWALLPEPPTSFRFLEAESMVQVAIRSSSTFSIWMRECRRLGVVVEAPDGKLMKATALLVNSTAVGSLKKI